MSQVASTSSTPDQQFGWFARALLWVVESLAAGLLLWIVLAAIVRGTGTSIPPTATVSLVSPFLLFYNVDRLIDARTADR